MKFPGSCWFDRLSIFINFTFFSSVFFPVKPENNVRFLEINNKNCIKL